MPAETESLPDMSAFEILFTVKSGRPPQPVCVASATLEQQAKQQTGADCHGDRLHRLVIYKRARGLHAAVELPSGFIGDAFCGIAHGAELGHELRMRLRQFFIGKTGGPVDQCIQVAFETGELGTQRGGRTRVAAACAGHGVDAADDSAAHIVGVSA